MVTGNSPIRADCGTRAVRRFRYGQGVLAVAAIALFISTRMNDINVPRELIIALFTRFP